MNKMNTIHMGKIDYNGSGRRNCPVEIEIELRRADTDKPELSICGTVWNPKHTDCYMAGQCIDDLMPYFPHNKVMAEILRLWTLYHLNGMHAGTIAQEKALHDAGISNWANEYDKACKFLEEQGLLIDNGYKFGSGWLYQGIPAEDLAKIDELLAYGR